MMQTQSDFKNILLDTGGTPDSGVAVITLNRPEVLNAMSRELVSELSNALVSLESDPKVRAVVITGSGTRAFSAGGDIHEMAASTAEELAAGRELVTKFGWYLANYRLPTIGAMNGLAYGGGAFLAAALDMRIGCERTRFRFLGAQYGRLNSTWSLPLIVGWARAKELLYSARVVEADEAAQMGLLNHRVSAAQVMDKSMELARQIARNPADQVQGAKQLLHQYVGDAWQAMFDAEYEVTRTRLKPSPVSEAFAGFLGTKGR
jgi:2-(1,2-epoxy-1,2-dihydrophenyl)acetyl-CoA isomerase